MDTEKIIKTIKFISLFCVTFLFFGCPEENFCDLDIDSTTILEPNLIRINPEKRVFQIGDSLNITIEIPSKGVSNDKDYNIFERLNQLSSKKSINISEVTTGNEITITNGQLDNSQIILDYSPTTKMYLFSCTVKLLRIGEYAQFGKRETIRFGEDNGDCQFIDLTTTIKGINEEGFYEFTVEK